MKDIYNLNNYTKYINDIVNRPIWAKEEKDEVTEEITDKENCVTTIVNVKTVYTDKINYVAFDYVTEQDKEDVKQCVITTLLEILKRVEKTGFLDNKQRYSIKDKKDEEIIKLIGTFLRNNSRYGIYKILKIDSKDRYAKSLDEIREKEVFVNKTDTERDVITRLLIKDVVKKFLKNRDKLDTMLFYNKFAELAVDLDAIDVATTQVKDIQKNKNKKRRKICLNWTDADIAYMCGVSVQTVCSRKKKLIADFKQVYLKDIKPYL